MTEKKSDDDSPTTPLVYEKCDYGDVHVQNFVKFTSRAEKVLKLKKSRLEPGEEMDLIDRLNCKALVQEALLEYAWIADDIKDSKTVQEITKPRMATIKELEEEIGLQFDEKSSKFVKSNSSGASGTEGKSPDDDEDSGNADDNVPDDEHENGAVRKFINAYKRARHLYFQTVYALEPGQDIKKEDALSCVKKFAVCQSRFEAIPKGIRSELRTRNTVGKIHEEIHRYLKYLQILFDECMDNEIDS